MSLRNRRTTPKGILEKVTGKKLENNILPSSHKVLIMEYLLSCPIKEVMKYKEMDYPTFIFECATLLVDDRINEYMNILALCKTMEKNER